MLAHDANRPKTRLLIIDDEDDVLVVLRETATLSGFDVSLATSVDAALQSLASGLAVDVVLCDVSMPDGGAEKWLREASVQHPLLAKRTMLITGWASPEDEPGLLAVNPDHCLMKPFTMSDVRRIADRLLADFMQ